MQFNSSNRNGGIVLHGVDVAAAAAAAAAAVATTKNDRMCSLTCARAAISPQKTFLTCALEPLFDALKILRYGGWCSGLVSDTIIICHLRNLYQILRYKFYKFRLMLLPRLR